MDGLPAAWQRALKTRTHKMCGDRHLTHPPLWRLTWPGRHGRLESAPYRKVGGSCPHVSANMGSQSTKWSTRLRTPMVPKKGMGIVTSAARHFSFDRMYVNEAKELKASHFLGNAKSGD